jgi:hypothetical protein
MWEPQIPRLRREFFSGVGGEILEIGFGTGLKLLDRITNRSQQ